MLTKMLVLFRPPPSEYPGFWKDKALILQLMQWQNLKKLWVWFKYTQELDVKTKLATSAVVITIGLVVGFMLFASTIHSLRWIFDIDNSR